ncbi:MAG TPA: hypothetical protein VG889_12825 [Rhizomicrobium sp.]|nr:hypothetical protein [Rhizomicrobium sp.]
MKNEVQTGETPTVLEFLSSQAKHYFTFGTTISTIVLPSVVGFGWLVLRKQNPQIFSTEWCPFALSFVVTLLMALLFPEPKGFPNSGKLRITREELVFGILNSFVLFVTVVAVDAWIRS